MRRSIAVALVAAGFLTLAAVDTLAYDTYTYRTAVGDTPDTSGNVVERTVDGFEWIVGANATIVPTTQYDNTCAPAQATACDQIVLSVEGVVVQGVAYTVIHFVTS